MPWPVAALTLLGMNDTTYSDRFLEHLAVRDFDGLATLFAPGASARFLLPRGPESQQGGEAITRRFRDWFERASTFEVLAAADQTVGARDHLSWRLRVVRAPGVPELIEQQVYVTAGEAGIERMDLLCSGFMPETTDSCDITTAVFDAGTLGCADGLAGEFERRIAAIPVGTSLVVLAADPAAKEDLPPLARLLGHAVKSTGTLADGRMAITVERRK